MQTTLAPQYRDSHEGRLAEAILRKCVHCGFCTATCPSYQILGNELDSPRGRIYLMKQVLEGHAPTRSTQVHLDRCLTCRNCETTCPSGVDYAHLLDVGRKLVDEQVRRPLPERALRWALKEGITSPLFAPALKLGQLVRGAMPASLKNKVPARQPALAWPQGQHERKVLMLAGCVQPAMVPNINIATARVLDALGVQTLIAPQAGCCGAVKFHLNDQEGGKAQMRANIDAWWPFVESGIEGIVMNASGCGVTVRDYAHLLQDDASYADKAQRISALTQDLSEWLPEIAQKLKGKVAPGSAGVAYHPPCSLQHGQRLRGGVEQYLGELGFDIQVARNESHLCCGSAGTYSVLQSDVAYALRDRKLKHLSELEPSVMVSANIGCITHLQSGTATPVKHWVELLDSALVRA